MDSTLPSLKMTAHIDKNGRLLGDKLLRELRGGQVEITVFLPKSAAPYDLDDPTDEEWMRALTVWNSELADEPDIYSAEDGIPYDASKYD